MVYENDADPVILMWKARTVAAAGCSSTMAMIRSAYDVFRIKIKTANCLNTCSVSAINYKNLLMYH